MLSRKNSDGYETIWVPLEATVVAQGFEAAWSNGAQRYFDDVEVGLGLLKGWVRVVDINSRENAMNRVTTLAVLMLAALPMAVAGKIAVYSLEGDVNVRRGVTEAWTTVAAGDVLRLNDSVRTGKNGSASLLVPASSPKCWPPTDNPSL